MSPCVPAFLLKVSTLALISALTLSLPSLASQRPLEEEMPLEPKSKKQRAAKNRTPKKKILVLPRILEETGTNRPSLYQRIMKQDRLSQLILSAFQEESNEAERAQRCLRAFLEETSFPSDLIPSRPPLLSLCDRLLQPEDLIWQDEKALILQQKIRQRGVR